MHRLLFCWCDNVLTGLEELKCSNHDSALSGFEEIDVLHCNNESRTELYSGYFMYI